MTDLIAPPLLRPVGSLVVSRGSNEFGDDAALGMVVGGGVSDEGERYVTVLTDAPRRPRQPSLILHHQDGKHRVSYDNLGLVAHLLRLTESDINPAGTDDFRHPGKVWTFAIKALRAAAVPPGNRPGRLHDELIATYHELRGVAVMLERGVET